MKNTRPENTYHPNQSPRPEVPPSHSSNSTPTQKVTYDTASVVQKRPAKPDRRDRYHPARTAEGDMAVSPRTPRVGDGTQAGRDLGWRGCLMRERIERLGSFAVILSICCGRGGAGGVGRWSLVGGATVLGSEGGVCFAKMGRRKWLFLLLWKSAGSVYVPSPFCWSYFVRVCSVMKMDRPREPFVVFVRDCQHWRFVPIRPSPFVLFSFLNLISAPRRRGFRFGIGLGLPCKSKYGGKDLCMLIDPFCGRTDGYLL